jgi:hypothetical protein
MQGKAQKCSVAPLLALVVLTGATGACASKAKTPLVDDGAWERIEVWEQRASFDYDRVATAADHDAVAWLGRDADDDSALAYWELRDGEDKASLTLPTPDVPVLIPVGVAVDDEGWAAVAVGRDKPNGANTGLLAWHGRVGQRDDVGPAQPLTPPAWATSPPGSASVARSTERLAVAAVYDERAVVWSMADDPTGSAGGAWESDADGADLGLPSDAGLTNLRIVGDGSRLVLAGVDGDGAAHLWTSTDGSAWSAVGGGTLPKKVGAVGVLASLGKGEVAVSWLADEKGAPWNASSARVQRLADERLVDEGTVKASPDDGVEQLHLTSAVRSPDGDLVVVGGAVRPGGSHTPMVWLREGGTWHPSKQAALTGHLDHEFRAVVTTRSDNAMVALATALEHPDVEAWQWRPD